MRNIDIVEDLGNEVMYNGKLYNITGFTRDKLIIFRRYYGKIITKSVNAKYLKRLK